jgi:hypothetical protein
MIASHDQLAHAGMAVNDADHDDNGGPKNHEHGNPHGFIGHLFTHMPLSFSSAPEIGAVLSEQADLPDPVYSLGHNFPEPPLRPPYSLFLVNA